MTDKDVTGAESYQTFVLRIWLEGQTKQCRVMLLEPASREQQFFDDFQAMAAYFEQITGEGC